MNNKGMNSVVATIFIILISVVAVGIVWFVVLGMLNIDSEDMNSKVSIVVSEGYTFCDIDEDILMVQVKRGADEEAIDYVDLVFTLNGDSYKMKVSAPSPNGAKSYFFNVSEFDSCFDSANVAPVFSDDGVEEEGRLGAYVEIPEKNIVDVPGSSIVIPNPNVGCFSDSDCDDGDYCTVDSCSNLACSYEHLPVCSDMIAWWRFEGDFTDEVGNYDGVANGDVGFVDSGVVSRGQAADFDGDGDYVSFDDIVLLDEWNWTIVYWSNSTGYSRVSMGNKDDSDNKVRHVYGNNKVWITNSLGQNDYVHTGSSLGTLLHVAFGPTPANYFNVYFDSVLSGENLYLPSSEIVINSIGKGTISSSDDWAGQLDEVMIFNKSLSSAEVASLYSFFS